jgi:hypothetical protein
MIYGKRKIIYSTHGRRPKSSLTWWKGNNAFGRELLRTFLWYGQKNLFPLLHKPRVDNDLEFIKEILQTHKWYFVLLNSSNLP